jgi:dTDP-4-amino-4,6-dideoxygalactose transaminase
MLLTERSGSPAATPPGAGAAEVVRPFPAPRPPAPILLAPPSPTGTELAAIETSLAAGWLAPAGPVPAAFEAALAEATGFPEVLATTSCTAALHLAYRVLGLAPCDEVWTAGLTFIATIAPAVQMGAVPRFLDVAPDSWTLDPGLLRAELARAARRGRLPRAVVPVDLFGQCADLDAILEACGRWGVPVLSDSAAALGASLRGRPAGQGALLAAFSFNGNKIITTGGGGALCTADPRLLAAARHLAAQAKEPAAHYQHETTGFAYGLSSVLAAIGLAQLPTLPARVAAKRAIFARYAAALADLPGCTPMPEPGWGRSNRWLSVILLDPARGAPDRERARRALAAEGIEARPVWKPLPLQPVFRDAPRAGGAVAARLFDQGLCLPSGCALTEAEQARVIATLRGLWPG